MRFTSCLANNMNTSVFQYYVKMTKFNNYTDVKGGSETTNKNQEEVAAKLSGVDTTDSVEFVPEDTKENASTETSSTTTSQ